MGVEEIDFEEYARDYASNCYLLDTSTLLWLIAEPERLSNAANAIWRDPDRMIAVSVISYWEIAIKKEKLGIHDVAHFWEDRVAPYADLETLQVREEHVVELLLLPKLHKDPFDRMLIAVSRREYAFGDF
jgi:PIN domain nuclease of toxin-antitoxin system